MRIQDFNEKHTVGQELQTLVRVFLVGVAHTNSDHL